MTDRRDLTALIEDPGRFLEDADPVLRRMAVTALEPAQAVTHLATIAHLSTDPDAAVAAAATEKLGSCGAAALTTLERCRTHEDPRVREATATAYGEIGDPSAIPWLTQSADDDADRGVREASVASLGAIGDPSAIEPLLRLIGDGPPQVRRRAIAAITVFDDDRIEPAIVRAAFDRNPGVREAAEMVVGRQVS